MGAMMIVVAEATLGLEPGLILLARRANPATGDCGSGEELQDHGCALASRF